jgi:hypothetical protein
MTDNLRAPSPDAALSVYLDNGARVLIAVEHPTSMSARIRVGVNEDDFPQHSGRYNLGRLVAALHYAQQLQGGGLNLQGEVTLCFCHAQQKRDRALAIRIGDSRTVLIVDPVVGGDE